MDKAKPAQPVPGSPAGHRLLPHTADVRIEAWGSTREACVAEAVAAMVASFADLSGVVVTTETTFQPGGESGSGSKTDEDLLVEVLDEVIFRMDTAGQLPVSTSVIAEGDALTVRMAVADLDQIQAIGAAPKAVALHGLEMVRGQDGWSCQVTLDV